MDSSQPHPPWNADLAQGIIDGRLTLDGALLPILHALQEAFGCVPREAVPLVADALNLTRAEVHGVVTFYADFREQPHGRRVLRVCRAEACQSMGGERAAAALLERLGVDWGGTTPDGEITVEPVYCLGLCAVAPAALVNGEPVGRLDGERLIAAATEPSP